MSIKHTHKHEYFKSTIHTRYHDSPLHTSCYLVKSKGPDGVGSQLHCVQQSDLDEAKSLCAPCRPVLITLDLQRREDAVRDVKRFICKCLYMFLWKKRDRERWLCACEHRLKRPVTVCRGNNVWNNVQRTTTQGVKKWVCELKKDRQRKRKFYYLKCCKHTQVIPKGWLWYLRIHFIQIITNP